MDTPTGETRTRIGQLPKEVGATDIARKHEINYLSDSGASVAVDHTAIRLGANGPVLAVGRDLRAITAMQQCFLDAQQEIEKSYWRARQAEARYRLLFQAATDAVLVVDARTLQILAANQAASRLFDMSEDQVLGRPIDFGFEIRSRGAVNELLACARASGSRPRYARVLRAKSPPPVWWRRHSEPATPFGCWSGCASWTCRDPRPI